MKKYFDVMVLPLSKELDSKLGIKHINVKYVENEKDPFGKDIKTPVRVNYRFKNNGSRKWMTNIQIESLKVIGVLPR